MCWHPNRDPQQETDRGGFLGGAKVRDTHVYNLLFLYIFLVATRCHLEPLKYLMLNQALWQKQIKAKVTAWEKTKRKGNRKSMSTAVEQKAFKSTPTRLQLILLAWWPLKLPWLEQPWRALLSISLFGVDVHPTGTHFPLSLIGLHSCDPGKNEWCVKRPGKMRGNPGGRLKGQNVKDGNRKENQREMGHLFGRGTGKECSSRALIYDQIVSNVTVNINPNAAEQVSRF